MSGETAYAVLKRLNATNLILKYGLTFEISGSDQVGIRLAGDTGPRVAFGHVFGFGALAFTDGAGVGRGLIIATPSLLTLTQAGFRIELPTGSDQFAIALSGDTDSRVSIGLVFGNGTIAWGDGAGATWAALSASSGLLALSSATFQASVTRRNVTKAAAWTFAIGDRDADIHYTGAGAVNATIPPNSSVAYRIGQELRVFNDSATGSVTVIPGAAVTINHPTGWLSGVAGQFSSLTYRQSSTDVWDLIASTDILGLELRYNTRLQPTLPVTVTTFTAAVNTIVPINTAANVVAVTLPTAPADGSVIVLKLIGPTPVVNAATYTCGGGDVLDIAAGTTSGSLSIVGQSVTLQYKLSSGIWYRITNDTPPLAGLDLRFAPLASPTFSGVVTAGGGEIDVVDGTAGHGNIVMGVAIGPLITFKANTGDTQARMILGQTGIQLGPGGSTTQDTKLLRTGVATANMTGNVTFLDGLTLTDAKDITIGGTTGSKIGQAGSKIGHFGSTPVAQPANTVATRAALVSLGLLASAGTVSDVATDPIVDAKGDLIVGTAADAAARLAVGTFGQTAVADTAATTGLIYANPLGLRDRYLAPNGATPCYESISRDTFLANVAIPTTGVVGLQAIALPKNFAVNRIAFWSATTAAVTPTHWWFSLCDSTYTTLRSTADQTSTAWAANTEKRIALSSAFTTTYEGLYYIAIMMTAATQVSLAGYTLLTAASVSTPLLAVTGDGSKTTAPADGTLLAAAPAGKVQSSYCYVD